MGTITKGGIKYKKTAAIVRKRIYKDPEPSARNAGDSFTILESGQNKGRQVINIHTAIVHKLEIAHEGANYYHLGATVSMGGEMAMVLKKDYKLL